MMNMYNEYLELESYVKDLEEHIKHLKKWYTNEENLSVQSNLRLLESAKSELRVMHDEYRTADDMGDSDDSYRLCSSCEDIMGEGHVIHDKYYCETCTQRKYSREQIDELLSLDVGYWTQWQ